MEINAGDTAQDNTAVPAEESIEAALLTEVRARRRSWAAVKEELGFDGRRVILDEIIASLKARRPEALPAAEKAQRNKPPTLNELKALAAVKESGKGFKDILDADGTAKYAAVLEDLEAKDRALELDCAKLDWQRKNPSSRGMSARVNADGSLQVDMWDGSDDELDAAIEAERREAERLQAALAELGAAEATAD